MRVSATLRVSGDTYAELVESTFTRIAEFLGVDEDEIESKVDIEIDISDKGDDALDSKQYAAHVHLRMKR